MIIFEDLDATILRSFGTVSQNKKAFVLKVNGKTSKVRSGKSMWSRKNFATSAVTNHLQNTLYYELARKTGLAGKALEDIIKEYKQYLYDSKTIEIVEITS